MNNLLTTKDLAEILSTTPAVIMRLLERDSQALPPAIKAVLHVRGPRKTYWRQSDVEAWLAALCPRGQTQSPGCAGTRARRPS